MRNSIAKKLVKLAKHDEKLILLAGDIGFRIFDEFIKNFPNRFYNCGIAEQNMISVAAGLASEGLKPVVYTIIPFLIMRAYEQIRVDVGINNQSLILIGVGGGLAYDKLGSTHHSYEDIALMRCIPNMNIYSPISPLNADYCLEKSFQRLSANSKGPSYIRLCKGGEPEINNLNEISSNIFITKKITSSKTIISTGAISATIENYLSINKKEFIVNHIMISEISNNLLEQLFLILKQNSIQDILLIEEHFEAGGLFEALSSIFIKNKFFINIRNMCLEKRYIFDIFDRENLLEKNGLSHLKIDSWLNEKI